MKGSILDMFPAMIIPFALLVGLAIASILYTAFSAEAFWNPTYSGDMTQVFSVMDYGAIAIMISMFVAVVISAFFIKTHPIFLPITLIIFIVVVMVSALTTNVFMGFATSTQIVSHANAFPNFLQFAGYIPYAVVGFGVLLLIAMYGKPGSA